MAFRYLICSVAFLILGFSPKDDLYAQAKPDFSKFEYQVTEDGAFGLYKPKGWTVGTQKYPNGRMVFTTDPQDLSYVSMLFLEKIDQNYDSVSFARVTLKDLSRQIPNLKILGARSSSDRMRTVVNYQRTGPQNVLIEGRYSFNIKRPIAVVFGYETPARHFKEQISILLTVITNITVQDPQVYQKLASQQKGGAGFELPMRETPAPDNTCRLLVPAGWTFNAGKGQALCTAPDGDIGYLYALIGFVGQSRIPHFDSRSIPGNLRYNYMSPTDALIAAGRHSGSSDYRVMERHSNAPWAKQASGYLKRGVDAEIALISCTSRNGVAVTGYYDVLGLHPDNAGQWAIIPMGFWAPTSQFPRHLPSLLKIAESYRMNEAWVKEYVRQGQERVREMMKKTSSMMSRYAEEMRQSSLASHQERMRSGDFISYKFSTYMRGEQEWVTSLNGGAIVKTDHWGLSVGGRYAVEGPPFNYYNFQGEKYGLIPVDSSREVFDAVKGAP
jgi:hypothetical protein